MREKLSERRMEETDNDGEGRRTQIYVEKSETYLSHRSFFSGMVLRRCSVSTKFLLCSFKCVVVDCGTIEKNEGKFQ
jgi:hypothetical protein